MCETLDPIRLAARRERLRVALTSPELHRAVHLTWLKFHREPSRWDEQLAQVDAILSGVAERALEHAALYDPERSGPIPWLLGVAINLLREQWRFAQRERERVIGQHALGEAGWQMILDRLTAPPEEASAADRREDVHRALAELTPEQRRVLELRYLNDLSWMQVAVTLGVSEGAARVRGCRALRALRDQVQGNSRGTES